MKYLAMVAVVGLMVASCGGQSSETTTTVIATTTSMETSTTTTQPTTTTSSSAATTSTFQEPDIVISGGTADDPDISIDGSDLFSFSIGDAVSIRIQSSVAGELHVHGYDLFFELVSGEITDVAFVAEIPGIFEAELEDTHTVVFEIEVTP